MGERACCVLTTGRHPLNRKFNKPHHRHIKNNTRSLIIALEAKITAAPTMQVTILACLAAVLVLAPAVRAQVYHDYEWSLEDFKQNLDPGMQLIGGVCVQEHKEIWTDVSKLVSTLTEKTVMRSTGTKKKAVFGRTAGAGLFLRRL